MTNNWFYVKQDEREGPVSQEYIEELLKSGEIIPATLVWNETMDDWQPASNCFPGISAPPSADSSSSRGDATVCNECGMIFAEGELSLFGGKPTCTRCLRGLEANERKRKQTERAATKGTAKKSFERKDNPMAVTGLILSIVGTFCCCGLFAIPGLICSISGYNTAKEMGGANCGKEIALAGIIISGIILTANTLGIIMKLFGLLAGVN